MRSIVAAFYCEALKVLHSRILWITVAAFLMLPLAGGFFMYILKDPELARSTGLISAKAHLAGAADWPSYLQFLAQGAAVGGLFVFGFVTSWVFGREYSDRTIKDLLALPIPRTRVVTAKFIMVLVWCLFLALLILAVGLGIGSWLVLPGWSAGLICPGIKTFLECTLLTIALSSPVAFFAGWGRGYLSPLGFVVFSLVLANVVAETGYGEYCPWAIPALYCGVAGAAQALPGTLSLVLVVLTSLAGLMGTVLWWRYADQN